MAEKYYYLRQSTVISESILVESSNKWMNSSSNRWIPASTTNTYKNMVQPFSDIIQWENVMRTTLRFDLKWGFHNESSLKDAVGPSYAESIKNDYNRAYKYISEIIEKYDEDINWLMIDQKSKDLYLCEHKKGSWSAQVEQYYIPSPFGGMVEIKKFTLSNTSVANGGLPFNKSLFDFSKEKDITHAVIELSYTKRKLASKGEYDIGSEYGGTNIAGNYCFYCKDATKTKYMNYLGKTPIITIAGHSSRAHELSKHDKKVENNTDKKTNTTNTTNKTTLYNGTTGTASATSSKDITNLSGVNRLQYGTTGNYVDGIARTPFVMIELRSSEDAKEAFQISVPTHNDSFVSLTHERNISDLYNTFSFQLFDKDAREVEAKLLLGFRYITFYYTDFVSTSKRFKGMVLDYKTTIAGKGLMLTVEGYSTNANVYIDKDSVPWSKLCEAGHYSFYYWLNEAGEYHGEVRQTEDGKFVSKGNNTVLVPGTATKIGDYQMQVYNEATGKYDYQTFEIRYKDIATKEQIKRYTPTPHKYTLEKYNWQLPYIFADTVGNDRIDLKEKRPSDIVKLICIINGWKYTDKTIVKTTSQSEIPDQISKSFIQYIKEDLLPISASEGNISYTNYYFWFDDEGIAHYAPREVDKSNIKKLYFNSPEHKDSYQLIGFTSSTNGSMLMVVDRSNVMEAINPYTGDELSSSIINEKSYVQNVIQSSEWYATSKIVDRGKDVEDAFKTVTYTNSSSIHSQKDLETMLKYRYGTVSRFTYKASLDVYGCADISPGDYIDIYIYLDEGVQNEQMTQSEIINTGVYHADETPGSTDMIAETKTVYKGNITMHHTSGRYMVTKIRDTVSAGKYVSSLEVLKLNGDGETSYSVNNAGASGGFPSSTENSDARGGFR